MSLVKKIKIFSRPDHSTSLYEGLKNKKSVDVNQFTFNAIKNGTVLSKIFYNKKHVSNETHVSLLLTIFHRALKPIRTRFKFNWLKYEVLLTEIYFSRVDIQPFDLVHYWPIYSANSIEKSKKRIDFVSVAEVYEANPEYVNKLFHSEYNKNKLNFEPYNTMTDQNYFLDFETNVIVPSTYVKNTYSSCRRFNEVTFHVVPYGVNPNDFPTEVKTKFKQNNKLKVVLVGRATIEKGIHLFAQAAQRLSSTVEFTVIGPVSNLPKRKLEEYSENINFLGSLDKKELFKNLINYDVVILPSLSDAYSLSIIEAQIIGLPVIVSTNVGNVDVISCHKSGLIFRNGDSEDLIRKIEEIDNHDTLKKLSENALKNRDFHFSESYADRVFDVYNKILKSSAP